MRRDPSFVSIFKINLSLIVRGVSQVIYGQSEYTIASWQHLQQFHRVDSFFQIELQHGVQNFFQVLRNVELPIVLVLANFCHHAVEIQRIEGLSASQQLQNTNSQSPHVAFTAVDTKFVGLRAHIERRTNIESLFQAGHAHEMAKSEIPYYIPVLPHQNVGWFDVPVNYSLLLQISQPVYRRLQELNDFRLGVDTFSLQQLFQILLKQLRYNVKVIDCLHAVLCSEDIRMIHDIQCLGLVGKERFFYLISQLLQLDNLDSHLSPSLTIAALVHLGAESGPDLVSKIKHIIVHLLDLVFPRG